MMYAQAMLIWYLICDLCNLALFVDCRFFHSCFSVWQPQPVTSSNILLLKCLNNLTGKCVSQWLRRH